MDIAPAVSAASLPVPHPAPRPSSRAGESNPPAGAIRPPSARLCLDAATGAVFAASADLVALPGIGAAELAAECLRRLNGGEPLPDGGNGEFLLAATALPPGGGIVTAHRQGAALLIEIEPLPAGEADAPAAPAEFDGALARLAEAADVTALCGRTAQTMRRLTGMERVLVCRFDAAGNGEVVAESLAADWEDSLLGLHFPAAGIPVPDGGGPPRFIPRRDHGPAPLVPMADPRSGAPFDPGRCPSAMCQACRGLHRELPGVDGSMSLPVRVEGRLWGVILGHHRQPHRVPLPRRREAAILATAFGLRLPVLERQQEQAERLHCLEAHARLLQQMAGTDDFVAPLIGGPVRLTSLFQAATGAAVVARRDGGRFEEVRTVGWAPECRTVALLARLCRGRLRGGVFATDHVAELLGAGAVPPEAVGLLAIAVGEANDHMILWFRPEEVTTTLWAGSPPEGEEAQEEQAASSSSSSLPRRVTRRHGHSRSWPGWLLDIAAELRHTLNDVILRQMRLIGTLHAQARALASANRELEVFAYVASHDLRQPLRMIGHFVEQLGRRARDRLTPQEVAFVRQALDGAARMERMIGDMLDYTRIGSPSLKPEPVDLSAAVAFALGSLEEEVSASGGAVSVAPDLPVVPGIRSQLERLFLNLIGNALKFREPGRSPSVAVSWRDGGTECVVSVADNGRGIAAADLERIFEFNVLGGQTAGAAANGIGLPACRKIAGHHGGRLWADSQPGAGSRFHIALPWRIAAEAGAEADAGTGPPTRRTLLPAASPPAGPPAARRPRSRPLHVLLVDANPGDSLLLSKLLCDWPAPAFTVTHAASLAEARVQLATGRETDVILLDLALPDGHGMAPLSSLQAQTPDLPMVVLTGPDDPAMAAQALECGAQELLIKGAESDSAVVRALLHAITRKNAQIVHRSLSERLAAEHQRVADDIAAARTMQFDLLPRPETIARITSRLGLSIASMFEPSSALGGDLWGVMDCGPGRLAVYAFDFAGHGISAALNVFRLHTLINEIRDLWDDPAWVLSHLNQALKALLPAGQYATMIFGLVDTDADSFLWSAAGAPRPVMMAGDGTPLLLDSRGKPLGLSAKARYVNHRTGFPEGAGLFLYSDALTEAMLPGGEALGEEGLLRLLDSYRDDGAGINVRAMVDGLHAAVGPMLEDDLTALCLFRPAAFRRAETGGAAGETRPIPPIAPPIAAQEYPS